MKNLAEHPPRTSHWIPTRFVAVRIALYYALLGGAWILFSGLMLHALVKDHDLAALLENVKGWVYVGFTALLLWLSLDRYFSVIRRSAQLLTESEDRLRLAAQSAKFGTFSFDFENNEYYLSPEHKVLLGLDSYNPGAKIETLIPPTAHPEDVAHLKILVEKAFDPDGDGQFKAEHRILLKDNSIRWILIKGQVSFTGEDSSRKPAKLAGMVLDITDLKNVEQMLLEDMSARKRAEEEAVTSHEKLETALTSMADAVFISDSDGRVVHINDAFATFLRFKDREEYLRSCANLTDLIELYTIDGIPEPPEQWAILRALGGQKASDRERVFRRKDTGETWIGSYAFAPIRDSGGSIIGAVFTARDITEQKQLQQKLIASEDRLRTLVESAPIGILVQADEKFAYINKSASMTFGAHSRAELLGQLVAERFHAETRDHARQRISASITKDRAIIASEEKCIRLDGTSFDAEFTSVPFIYDGRKGALVFFRDITERKQLETRLRQTQKLEAIGQLAGGVAHDFNNILAAMLMQLELLQMNRTLDDEIGNAIKDMEILTQRAAGLTRQLLMFGRRSVMTVKPVDLNELIANLLKMLTRLIGENINLRYSGIGALPRVEADIGMIEQVLVNLVVNARDAIEKGGQISIRTSTAQFDAIQTLMNSDHRPGRFVCVAVSDNGCGMDPATLKRIFEPFFTTKEAGKGTGLGLATVYGIVAQHKGWIEVETSLGEGSTFSIFLPEFVETSPVLHQNPEKEPLRHGKETILLVEDEPSVRQLTKQILANLGYSVYEAANGQEGMEVWRHHANEVELLITDMVMPEGMTGLELAERLQDLKPGLKAILMSGYSSEIAHAGITKTGILYLAKPFESQTLARAVRECLDHELTR